VSDTARVARTIQQVVRLRASRPDDPRSLATWFISFDDAVDDLVAEAKGALHLTEDDMPATEEPS
jgi:hypothetical protein